MSMLEEVLATVWGKGNCGQNTPGALIQLTMNHCYLKAVNQSKGYPNKSLVYKHHYRG